MAFFKKLFKKDSSGKTHKGFYNLTIQKIEKLTAESVKVTLDVPEELKKTFQFIHEFAFLPSKYGFYSSTSLL